MTVIGIDDTDSRERGMCTTYVAARVAAALTADADVDRRLLVRLNPAVEHKTRGNAAVAIHTSATPDRAFEVAQRVVAEAAETNDPNTNPGVVVAPGNPTAVADDVAAFAQSAVRELLTVEDAADLVDEQGYRSDGWKNQRGLIGALAAVGAWAAFDDWTYEHISYRERERWGTDRDVNHESLFAAAADAYPDAWDTVDVEAGEPVCVPHTPCPILYGIRGDDPDAVRTLAARVDGEPVAQTSLFVTNQGTDIHLQNATIADVQDGHAYRIPGTVAAAPETRAGGHVFVPIEDGERLDCVAFEPTKRFRDRVRALHPGDRILACGEVKAGTLKLEKFAVIDLQTTERVTPTCPGCGRTMKSAGADQGYRCRDCGETAPGKVKQPLKRELEVGWYEVPPVARRHIAKPLVRGEFDAPVHAER